MDDVAFRQKLRHMGKSTKKKFSKMAKRFSRRNSGNRPQFLHASDSTFNLLENNDEGTLDFQINGGETFLDTLHVAPTIFDPHSQILIINANAQALPDAPAAGNAISRGHLFRGIIDPLRHAFVKRWTTNERFGDYFTITQIINFISRRVH